MTDDKKPSQNLFKVVLQEDLINNSDQIHNFFKQMREKVKVEGLII